MLLEYDCPLCDAQVSVEVDIAQETFDALEHRERHEIYLAHIPRDWLLYEKRNYYYSMDGGKSSYIRCGFNCVIKSLIKGYPHYLEWSKGDFALYLLRQKRANPEQSYRALGEECPNAFDNGLKDEMASALAYYAEQK
jgi:hypothetical protein